MRSFIYRLASLLLRFACPLAILALSTQSILGKYYLFTAFVTLTVVLVSLEIAVPFSSTYLRAGHADLKRKVFTSLLLTQAGLGLALSLPVVLVYGLTVQLPPHMIALLLVVVVSEACVNESGRLFWNVGLSRVASRRDLVRATGFTAAIIAGVVLDGEIVTETTLFVMLGSNALIIGLELRHWGELRALCKSSESTLHNLFRKSMKRALRSIRRSSPYLIHLQLLALQPLLERLLIERASSLEIVGAYSFQYSLISSGVALILLPVIADVRRATLAVRSEQGLGEACQRARRFLFQTLAVGLLCAVAAYVALPILGALLQKQILASAWTMGVAWLSASSATIASAVAPLYAPQRRIFLANFSTAFAMIPLLLGIIIAAMDVAIGASLALTIIGFSCCVQLLLRTWYVRKRPSAP